MKKLKKFFLSSCIPASVVVMTVALALNPTACSSGFEGIEILEGDFRTPKMEAFSVISDNLVKIGFNKEISLVSAVVNSKDGEVIDAHEFENVKTSNEDKCSLMLELNKATKIGKDYICDICAKDVNGNTITLSVEFTGFNSNPARLIFSEIRNSYGTYSSGGVQSHKSEFVELYALKDGNLSGLEIYSASDGEEKKYVFPAVDVKAGDYITVHMRKIVAEGFDGEGMIDELEDDLTLSTHIDSCDTARDLWSSNTKAVFADNDIIVLRNSLDKKIMDSFLCAKNNVYVWKTEELMNYASDILDSQTWYNLWDEFSCEAEYAACSDNVTSASVARSFSRQNVKECAELYAANPEAPLPNCRRDWIVTADKGSGSSKIYGVTPGYENSTIAYVLN